MSTSGQPKNFTYDPLTKFFYYEFIPDFQSISPTEIYVPPKMYPNHQFEVQLSENLAWEFSLKNPNIIFVIVIDSKAKINDPVFVKITPKVKIENLK